MANVNGEKDQETSPVLLDSDIVCRRVYGRRRALMSLGAALVASGAVVAGLRTAKADPIVGDADRFSEVVNPDPQADTDPEPRPSDPGDADQSTAADPGDSDTNTYYDPKVQTDAPDSDGSLQDPKDADQPSYADQRDAD